MRLMILRAALLAADTELAAGAPEVQTPAPEDPAASAADAPADQVDETGAQGPLPTAEQAAELARTGAIGSQAQDPDDAPITSGDPAAEVGSGVNSGQVERDTRPAPMGAPVLVRQGGKLAPGIVVEEDEGGSGITVQIFRGDHLPHAAHHLQRTTVEDTSDGWFYPWERRSL